MNGKHNIKSAYIATAIASALVFTACPPRESTPPAPPQTPASQPANAPTSTTSSAIDNGSTPATRDFTDADGTVRRGVALTDAKPMTVTELIAGATTLSGKSVKVTGKVESVCAKKGCWFVIAGDKLEDRVRITFRDYKFFMPKNAAGMSATIEGELKVSEVDVETAQHLEDERVMGSNEPAKKITAPVQEVAISAVGIVAKKSS